MCEPYCESEYCNNNAFICHNKNNMNECEGGQVKRRKKNPACPYDLPDGSKCTKTKQYSPDNPHRYCREHFIAWSRDNAHAGVVTAESTTNLGFHHVHNDGAPFAGDVLVESTSVVPDPSINDDASNVESLSEPSAVSTLVIGTESHDENFGATSAGDLTAVSTSIGETNTTTTDDAPTINDEVEQNESMHTTSIGETNTTTTDDAPNINDEVEQNESMHTQTFRVADIPAAIGTSHTVATISAPATAINQELILSSIERFVQNGFGRIEATLTEMRRSVENLQSKFNELQQIRDRQRVNETQAHSPPTISTASDDQDRNIRAPTISRGVNINAGLINNGATCYLNAYLQIIASLPFVPECLSQPPPVSAEIYPLYFSFATVISSMVRQDETRTIVDPTNFIVEFLRACQNFNYGFQSFDQRKLNDCKCIIQHDGRLLTLEHYFNNC